MLKKAKPKPSKVFSVSQVAEILQVDKQTVYKWLSTDAPEYAVIPSDGWFRLPLSGHIRIKGWVVDKLKAGDL